DSELEAALQKLGQGSASDVTEDTDNASTEFHSTISRVLKDLTTNSENLQNDVNLAAMLEQTSLDGEAGNVLPFMQEMMKQLLSKDILYTPVKELSDKYPAWLEEHKATLSPSDLQRIWHVISYRVRKVCTELEKEKEDDTEDTKKHRFETVLKLMTEMQNYGQAPEDLVGEQNTLFQFDAEGNPFPLPGADSQQECCIM
ncbi:Peroxisomal biogenesis factor, partial [Ooceraea biroi]